MLWIYIGLLFIGGLIGFLKANSKISLITSTLFAVILILCNIRVIPAPRVADYVMLFLFIFFSYRVMKSKKFMPSGLMSAVTLICLVLRNVPMH